LAAFIKGGRHWDTARDIESAVEAAHDLFDYLKQHPVVCRDPLILDNIRTYAHFARKSEIFNEVLLMLLGFDVCDQKPEINEERSDPDVLGVQELLQPNTSLCGAGPLYPTPLSPPNRAGREGRKRPAVAEARSPKSSPAKGRASGGASGGAKKANKMAKEEGYLDVAFPCSDCVLCRDGDDTVLATTPRAVAKALFCSPCLRSHIIAKVYKLMGKQDFVGYNVLRKSGFPKDMCFVGLREGKKMKSVVPELSQVYSIDGTFMDTGSDFLSFHKGRSSNGQQKADSYILEKGDKGLMGETYYRWVFDAFRNSGTLIKSHDPDGLEHADKVMEMLCVDKETLTNEQKKFRHVADYLCNNLSELENFSKEAISKARTETIDKLKMAAEKTAKLEASVV
jgi:hypothetical protein